jgi:hypothetical protein
VTLLLQYQIKALQTQEGGGYESSFENKLEKLVKIRQNVPPEKRSYSY